MKFHTVGRVLLAFSRIGCIYSTLEWDINKKAGIFFNFTIKVGVYMEPRGSI